jgi:hypothetical protein
MSYGLQPCNLQPAAVVQQRRACNLATCSIAANTSLQPCNLQPPARPNNNPAAKKPAESLQPAAASTQAPGTILRSALHGQERILSFAQSLRPMWGSISLRAYLIWLRIWPDTTSVVVRCTEAIPLMLLQYISVQLKLYLGKSFAKSNMLASLWFPHNRPGLDCQTSSGAGGITDRMGSTRNGSGGSTTASSSAQHGMCTAGDETRGRDEAGGAGLGWLILRF